MAQALSYCTYCGSPLPESEEWPRTCASCGRTTFRNPLPVCVVLVPVEGGVLAVRRGIEPRRGFLALPGGYINWGESWQEAGAREVYEETGIPIDPAEINELRVRSAPDGTLIIFGAAAPRELASLPPFIPNPEASERVILNEPVDMAYPLHEEIVREFFNGMREA